MRGGDGGGGDSAVEDGTCLIAVNRSGRDMTCSSLIDSLPLHRSITCLSTLPRPSSRYPPSHLIGEGGDHRVPGKICSVWFVEKVPRSTECRETGAWTFWRRIYTTHAYSTYSIVSVDVLYCIPFNLFKIEKHITINDSLYGHSISNLQ